MEAKETNAVGATSFGRWVEEKREMLGLSKAECARRANPPITVQRWAQIEYAKPANKAGTSPHVARSTAILVADALGIPHPEALLAAGYYPHQDAIPDELVRYWLGLNGEGRRIASVVLESLYLRPDYRKP